MPRAPSRRPEQFNAKLSPAEIANLKAYADERRPAVSEPRDAEGPHRLAEWLRRDQYDITDAHENGVSLGSRLAPRQSDYINASADGAQADV
jgi:hypothetical protein